MDERAYLVEAFFDRLQDEGVPFSVLNEEAHLAVPQGALAGMPRRLARFAQDYDLGLVQLLRPAPQAWQALFAWSDDVGRPSFLCVRVLADYHRAARRLLRGEELLTGAPDVLFIYALLEAVEQQALDPKAAAWLSKQWAAAPRSAIERVGRYWRKRPDIRLVAQAAKHASWDPVRQALPRLRRRLHRALWPDGASLLAHANVALENRLRPNRVRVAFVGAVRRTLRERLAQDLASAGIGALEQDKVGRAEIGVAIDPPEGYRHPFQELVVVDQAQALPAAAAEVERALLRWLECRVERRYPDAMIGENPFAARLLQFLSRHPVPLACDLVQTLLNCAIQCRVRSPILMPHPHGIVIHRNALIGSRVTIMHQVTIGTRHPADSGAPVIEDNVYIGAGAKVLGAIRVGRGATVGANAVVTRDVPSHCTVVGVNRILGGSDVVHERQLEHAAVVNT